MMRKLFVALLVGAVTVGLAAPALAADLKFTGAYRVRFQFDENSPCLTEQAGTDCTGHEFQARFRPRFDVETDGGVKGVIRLEIGDLRFGETSSVGKGATGGLDTDGVNVETKWAYIDFPVPATPFRLMGGLFGVFTSKALVIDADFPGLSLYGKVGDVNLNVMWLRANDTVSVDGTPTGSVSSTGINARDLYVLDATFSPMRDLNLNGYFIYDHDSEAVAPEALTGYWIGVGAAGKMQNIRWDADFVYGTKETGATTDQSGFVLDAGIGMALAGTPLDLELRGWYATGHDSSAGDSDAYPDIAAGHETGAQIWSGGGDVDIDEQANTPQNTWGIGLIARYTVSPTLKLTANAHYIGTQEEGTVAIPSPVGDGNLSGVDKVGIDLGAKIDYTIARGLVFTFLVSHLFIGDDTSINGTTRFDDVTKIAGVLNYGF